MSKHSLLEKIAREGRKELTEIEAKELLGGAGIPIVETKLATSAAEAVDLSQKLAFPVVIKIASPDILHKSDIGGVKLGIKTARQVTRAYEGILAAARKAQPSARIDGVSVQRMARPGLEVIIGMSQDPHFGPVMMFGLGGILVEVLKDVAFRIVPLAPRDARDMIREIKGYPLLEGYRGQEPANIPVLEELLLKVSEFIEKHPEVKELDLNPIFAYRDEALVVDARIILN